MATTTDRDAKRKADRERLAASIERLWTSDGWRQWSRTRRMFRTYSFTNQLLIALQRPTATRVAGVKTWNKLGRTVTRGERGIRIVAPRSKTLELEDGTEEKRIFFVHVSVFDIEQTQGEPLVSPHGDIEGDSHADFIERLVMFANSIGYSVDFEPVAGNCGGWCDYSTKRIVVDSTGSENEQLATLAHEIAHALGATSKDLGRHEAEVVAEAAAHLACAGLGLAIDDRSCAYLAGWAEKIGVAALRKHAQMIDTLARQIEEAALVVDRQAVAA